MKKSLILWAASLPLLFLTACGGHEKAVPELNVMSFNMRYDNPEDGENNWQYRRERVARVIAANDVDLFGAQELLVGQLNDLKGLLPGYAEVGVGREDGAEAGEFNPVFYRTDRFELLDWGTFWLSETPEVAGSKGWDGACERLATWTVLRDRDGRELFFINTHLDHMGEVARREGVSLLLGRIDSLSGGRPVVLTGDFNATPDSEVIAHVLADSRMRHTRDVADVREGASWSFADYGSIPEADRQLIDYVFVNDGLDVPMYRVLPDTLDGGYLSDHAPVLVKLQYNASK
ncbi:endonuclease/exonuclease/phosphatase family protein [uncultured Alistipes sp.]|uniref:endonuclease/exonuclease/phosphatase family protein n=1 Tax=uncultured Alistipes sp. TaxID=538949 RepID=UPI002805F384|nr:endonuclease/exonuclease/phosphatase family protein [uncultured Alistipes sp.]